MSSLDDAVEITANWITNAAYTVIIYDNEFDPKVYQHPDVLKAMSNAGKRKVKIDIICDNNAEILSSTFNAIGKYSNIKVHRMDLNHRKLGLPSHFMVTDTSHTRVEMTHTLDSDERHGDLMMYCPHTSKFYTKHFNKVLENYAKLQQKRQ